jgi:predicted flap endonuclease-1-like 5' DNA nuclease
MSLHFNPWVALVLGILIGWLLEWLLELWYFRRQRLECQRRLADVEAQLKTRDDELRGAHAQVASLEADVQGLKASAVVEAPAVEVEAPAAKLAGAAVMAGVGAGIVGLAAGEGEEAPETVLPEAAGAEGVVTSAEVAELARVVTAEVGQLESQVASLEVEAPAPGVEGEAPKVGLAGIAIGAGAVALAHELKAEAPTAEAELPGVEVEAPAGELEAPQVELPEVEAEAPKVGLPGIAIGAGAVALAHELKAEAPTVEGELPGVEVEAPAEELEAPQVELPEVEAEAPEAGLAGVAIGAGAVALAHELKAEAPTVEAELPGVEVEAPEVELEGQKVELPEVVIGAPEAGLAGVAIGAGAVALAHELKAEAPTVEAEVPEVEVRAPEVEAGIGVGIEADDLAAIKGIGPKYVAQLAAAGITSYAALAEADPVQLRAIINAPEWRQVDYDGWIAEAKVLANAPRRVVMGEDLTRLEGIGPVYAAKLRHAGIASFAQLAEADEARLAEIVQAPAWRRVNFAEWIQQARLAAAGDEAGLKALQDKLFSHQRADNLALVAGIGEKTAAALGAAGITSFAALSESTPERLAEITKTAGVRGGDFEAWIGEAKLRAAGKRVRRATRSAVVSLKVSCPQDLSRIKGVGSVYETRLYAAGIGSYWELSEITDEDLMRVLGAEVFQQVDIAAIRAAAVALAEETDTVGRYWDGTPPDDFEPLEGIGEVYEGRLYDAGICSYRAMADATVEQLAEICKAPDSQKPDYASWIAQAKRLIDQEG